MNLSAHFTLEEMVASSTAKAKKIDNTPTQEVINNLKELCVNVLEPLRVALGKPISVTSGFRCAKLNKAIGGASNSQHQTGQAADIQVKGMTPKQVCDKIDELVRKGIIKGYDQLIEEYGATGWCHVSYVHNPNRKMRFKIGC